MRRKEKVGGKDGREKRGMGDNGGNRKGLKNKHLGSHMSMAGKKKANLSWETKT